MPAYWMQYTLDYSRLKTLGRSNLFFIFALQCTKWNGILYNYWKDFEDNKTLKAFITINYTFLRFIYTLNN